MSIIIILLLMFVSALLGSIGTIFLKLGSKKLLIKFKINGIIIVLKNWRIILGLGLLGLSTIGFIYLLRTEDLSFLYPLTSVSYIFVTVFSVWFLKEKINVYKILGIALIIFGVWLVTLH